MREPSEVAGREAEGEIAKSGPSATTSSGFGGLGLEGMVGMEDPVGTGSTPPGEGKRGEMSGDNGGRGDRAGFSKTAGDVEIVEVCKCSCSGDKDSKGESMKGMMSTKRSQKEAILMIMKSISTSWRL